jgi:hypothetical protein
MPAPDEQMSTFNPKMITCHIDVGSYQARFAISDEAASSFNNDLLKILAKYGEFIEWSGGVGRDSPPPPRKRRSRSKGPHVRAREQLLELKKAGSIPPEIDELISWTRNDAGQLSMPSRGPMDARTREAYWLLVDRKIITNPIPRPVRKSRGNAAT